MPDLHHLAYVSHSLLGEHEGYILDEMEQILASSQRNNPPLAITGALMYSGGFFCQLLEGPRTNVELLYAKLLDDDRHDGSQVLFSDPAPERLFGTWAMAYAGVELKPSFKLPSLKRSVDDLRAQGMGRNMVVHLARLVAHREATEGLYTTTTRV